jgi:effector-binding domain-containing protein
MKILKYLFLLLLLCAIAGFVFITTQPGEYAIVKNKEISSSKEVVFNFVNNYENYHLWNSNIDSTSAKELFSEDFNTYTISDGNESLVYKTLQVFKTDSITQKLTQDNLTHNLVWKFTSTKKGTLLSCAVKGKMTLKQKVFSVFHGGAQNYLGDDIQKNLTNIDKYLSNQLNKFNIKINGLITKEGTLYIKQIDSSSTKATNTIALQKTPNLIKFAKEISINYKEKPFIIYNNLVASKFSICLPINEEIITSQGSDIEGGELLKFKAVKAILTGDYSHINKAKEAAYKYIKKNKLVVDLNGTFIDVFIVYKNKEKQPSKWVTEIYIPVKIANDPRTRVVSSDEIVVLPESKSVTNETE